MNYLAKDTLETVRKNAAENRIADEFDLQTQLLYPLIDRRVSDRRISDRRKTNWKKITILIPCYNEEKGIGKVIDGVPNKKLADMGYRTEIIVINNNLTFPPKTSPL